MTLETSAFTEEKMALSAEDFVQPSRVTSLMHSLPRFGHDSNFAKLASGNQDEQIDYVVGIIAGVFFILSLFIFWGAAIVSCKCMGERRVGLLSGRMHLQPDIKGRFRPPLFLWKLRFTFMFLGCCIIGCSLMLAMPATKSVVNASGSSLKTQRQINDLMDQGLLIVADLSRVKMNFNTLDIQSALEVKKFCPDFETFASDESVNDSIQVINEKFDDVNDLLASIDFESVRNSIDFVKSGTYNIETAANLVQDNDWIVRMYVLVLDVVVLFMLVAASEILDKNPKIDPALQMMVRFFIFPLFVVCVVLAVAASAIFAVVSTANSDFCAVSPEVTISNILEERGLRHGSTIYDYFEYYQTGCKTTSPMDKWYEYDADVQNGITLASDFIDRFNEVGIEKMNDKCEGNVRPLVEFVIILRDNLGILLNALRSTFEATSCSRVSLIYKRALNEAACAESASGLTLMFMATITIAAIGMVMIMLRSAMHPYQSLKRNPYLDQDEKVSEHEEYNTYVGYMADFVNMWKNKEDDGLSDQTRTFSGSINTKSEEEKPLSPTTPAINWENQLTRPELKYDDDVDEVSSLMFSPKGGSERNFFNTHSPLSRGCNKIGESSQNTLDSHGDEETPSTISWDNDWVNKVNRYSTSALGMALSPRSPLSPSSKVSKDEEKLVITQSAFVPSLRSGSVSEIKFGQQPYPHSKSLENVTDEMIIATPKLVCKKMNTAKWHGNGEKVPTEFNQMTSQGRDDQDAARDDDELDERSTPNYLHFISPLRRESAVSYKKID